MKVSNLRRGADMQDRLRLTEQFHRRREWAGFIHYRTGVIGTLVERHAPRAGRTQAAPPRREAHAGAVIISFLPLIRSIAEPAMACEKEIGGAHLGRRPGRSIPPLPGGL